MNGILQVYLFNLILVYVGFMCFLNFALSKFPNRELEIMIICFTGCQEMIILQLTFTECLLYQAPLQVLCMKSESESHSVVSDSLRPHGLQSPWNSPGQNTEVGSLSLLQGIFPTQGSNPGLPHGRRILYQMSHKVSPSALHTLNHLIFTTTHIRQIILLPPFYRQEN